MNCGHVPPLLVCGGEVIRPPHGNVPVGLLIYAVLADWKKDFDGTLTAVARMGYEGLELTQYESWTPARAKEVRALLDGIKLKVFATHTEPEYFLPGDKMKAAISRVMYRECTASMRSGEKYCDPN